MNFRLEDQVQSNLQCNDFNCALAHVQVNKYIAAANIFPFF